jgi:hypothetical protein
MTLPKALKTLGRKIRSIILPMGDIPHHMQQLTRKTVNELGFKSITVRQLEELTIETCYEIGIGVNHQV